MAAQDAPRKFGSPQGSRRNPSKIPKSSEALSGRAPVEDEVEARQRQVLARAADDDEGAVAGGPEEDDVGVREDGHGIAGGRLTAAMPLPLPSTGTR